MNPRTVLDILLGWGLGVLMTLIVLAASGVCEAADVDGIPVKPTTYLVDLATCTKSPYDAVTPVFTEARRLMVQNGWEYGGMIVRRPGDGFYCVSQPRTSEHPTAMRFMWHLPEGFVLSGTYHTHPGHDLATYYFSATDVASACLLGRVSYIITENRLVLKFMPTSAVCDSDVQSPVGGVVIDMVRP